MTKFCIFLDPTRTFSALMPERGKYRNSKKNWFTTDGCSTIVPIWTNFGLQTPEIQASVYNFFKKLRFLAYISGAAEHTFAKLLPMVDLRCLQIPQYLGSCDVFPKLHGGPKNVEILHIFGPPYSHARTQQNIVILKWTVKRGCSTRVPSLVNFGLQNHEFHAS